MHQYQQLIRECSNYQSVEPLAHIELSHRVETVLAIVEEGMRLLSGSSFVTEYSLLYQMRGDLSQHLRLLLYGVNDCTVPPVSLYPCMQEYTGSRGRPKNIDAVELLRSCGYTWNEVAGALQVSRSTIWRRVKDAGIQLTRYNDISDDELDGIISQFQSDYPNCGQQLILGHLRDKGISVQRYRLRESIARTDPLRRLVRWHQVVSRRTYSVKKSNSLWHIDGHHSLIRWRIVVHGGIDGYSRMITYLSGSTTGH